RTTSTVEPERAAVGLGELATRRAPERGFPQPRSAEPGRAGEGRPRTLSSLVRMQAGEPVSMPNAPFEDPRLEYRAAQDGARAIEVHGSWSLPALRPRLRELRAELERAGRDEAAAWDLRAVRQLDHVGAALLWHAWGRR